MENTIKSIRKSLEDKNYLAALALTLTIPDVCGHVEFPNDGNGDRYRKWYDRFFDNAFNGSLPTSNPNNLPIPPRFNSADCYELRCAVLHSGNTDMKVTKINFDRFKLFRNINVQGGVKWEAGKPQTEQKYIYLDITRFCTLMCDVAEKYYNSRKADFSKYHVEIR